MTDSKELKHTPSFFAREENTGDNETMKEVLCHE